MKNENNKNKNFNEFIFFVVELINNKNFAHNFTFLSLKKE